MTRFLLNLIGLTVLIILIAQDTWHLTLKTGTYEITISFVLFIVICCIALWFYQQLKKPLAWGHKLKTWHQKRVLEQKETFLLNLLNTLLNHDMNKNTSLITEAQKLYGPHSEESTLVTALLKPSSDIFQQLNQTEKTRLAGLYGLIQQAQSIGNLEEVAQLLEQIPTKYAHTPWVHQTQQYLAFMRNDWSEALRLLEQNKKYISTTKYKSDKAVLLLKLGQLQKAYKLCPNHPAIALMYAKVNPSKAKKTLETTWKKNPGWAVYLGYKQALHTLPHDKQMKDLLKLTRSTRDERCSLLARADMDIELKNWLRAKENLDVYLQNYPLTRQVADMMATIERTGWHHEQEAQQWDHKAIESENDSLWICTNCSHTSDEWQALCPHCNHFNSLCTK